MTLRLPPPQAKTAERLALEARALAAFEGLSDRRKRVGVLRAMHDPSIGAQLDSVEDQK